MPGKIVMVTAYDYPSAFFADTAGADIILVGDSAANVVHGFESTRKIGMNEMLLHVKAVLRAKPKALVVADMPFGSYKNPQIAIRNAKKFLRAGADAVKLEGTKYSVIKALVKKKIKVMGHLGYLPQLGKNPKVEGENQDSEQKLIQSAQKLEKADCSWLVLELVKETTAKKISKALEIPVIGIGAGRYCDGQVLVFHDILGFNPVPLKARFIKRYANIGNEAISALAHFARDVRSGKFPGERNIYN